MGKLLNNFLPKMGATPQMQQLKLPKLQKLKLPKLQKVNT
jgi:hypothetical protein